MVTGCSRVVAWGMGLMLFSLGSMSCCTPGESQKHASVIDTSDFHNSAHHWYDIYEAKNVINAVSNLPRFKEDQIKDIADNILLYQKNNGGWPKNYDMRAILTDKQKEIVAGAKGDLCTTFDNCTTYSHIKYLAWAYELPSICNRESVGIVLFLMSLDHPSRDVINSVQAAMQWFEDSKISGIRVEVFETPPVKFPLRTLTTDKRVVKDVHAPPIWARFYELATHRPLFSNRQSQRLYALAQVDRERRAYGWYTYEPQKLRMRILPG